MSKQNVFKILLLSLSLGSGFAACAMSKQMSKEEIAALALELGVSVETLEETIDQDIMCELSSASTPNYLIYAALDDNAEEVQRLIEAGAQLDVQDNQGHTALMKAALFGNNPACCELLIKHGANLDLCDMHGSTALYFALSHGKPAIARLLIEAGADVFCLARLGRFELLPLEVAVSDAPECCEPLVEAMLGLRPSQKRELYFIAHCISQVRAADDNSCIDIAQPLCERIKAAFEDENRTKTKNEIDKIGNAQIKQTLLALYFPDELKKN